MLTVFGPAIVLGALALIGRSMGGNWLVPAALFPLIWGVLLSVAGVLRGLFPLEPVGLWVLTSMLISFQVGALAVHYAGRSPASASRGPAVDGTLREALAVRLVWVTAPLSLLAAIGVALMVWTGGVTFGIDLSLLGLLRLGNLFSIARYAGVGDLPITVRAFVYWIFPAALLGGMLGAVAHTPARRLLSAVPLLLSLAAGVIVAARAGLLLSLEMWMAGFLAVQIAVSGGTYSVFRAKWILGAVVAAVSLIGVSVALQWLRAGIWRRLVLEVLVGGTAGDFFGSISAFTTWFETAEPLPPALGAVTFAGPFDLLGLATRAQGLYELNVYFPSGRPSNIYTMFRGLIQDFGVVGAWGTFLIGGVLSTIAYRRCSAGRIQWAVPLSLFYGIALFSNLSSVFVYNSVIMGWVVAMVVWLWPTRQRAVQKGPESPTGAPVRGLA